MTNGVPDKERVAMAEATRLTTIFDDGHALRKIGLDLEKRGLITGFRVEPVETGYTFQGKHFEGGQFLLRIILPPSVSPEDKQNILDAISAPIKERWDVPLIEEDRLSVNREFAEYAEGIARDLTAVGRKQRRTRRLLYAVLAGVGVALGAGGVQYVRHDATAKARKAERAEAIDRLQNLVGEAQRKAQIVDDKIAWKKPFTFLPSDMAGAATEEVDNIIKTIRESEQELKKLQEEDQ